MHETRQVLWKERWVVRYRNTNIYFIRSRYSVVAWSCGLMKLFLTFSIAKILFESQEGKDKRPASITIAPVSLSMIWNSYFFMKLKISEIFCKITWQRCMGNWAFFKKNYDLAMCTLIENSRKEFLFKNFKKFS